MTWLLNKIWIYSPRQTTFIVKHWLDFFCIILSHIQIGVEDRIPEYSSSSAFPDSGNHGCHHRNTQPQSGSGPWFRSNRQPNPRVSPIRRRMLLGSRALIPESSRSGEDRGRLLPGPRAWPKLQVSLLWIDEPRWGGSSPFRPVGLSLHQPLVRVLEPPRPHHTQSPGRWCRDSVPIRHILLQRVTSSIGSRFVGC